MLTKEVLLQKDTEDSEEEPAVSQCPRMDTGRLGRGQKKTKRPLKEQYQTKQTILIFYNMGQPLAQQHPIFVSLTQFRLLKKEKQRRLYEHKLLLRAVTKVSDPWIKRKITGKVCH